MGVFSPRRRPPGGMGFISLCAWVRKSPCPLGGQILDILLVHGCWVQAPYPPRFTQLCFWLVAQRRIQDLATSCALVGYWADERGKILYHPLRNQSEHSWWIDPVCSLVVSQLICILLSLWPGRIQLWDHLGENTILYPPQVLPKSNNVHLLFIKHKNARPGTRDCQCAWMQFQHWNWYTVLTTRKTLRTTLVLSLTLETV